MLGPATLFNRRDEVPVPSFRASLTSGYTKLDRAPGKLDVGVELLSKPYSHEAMARKIRHVLNNSRQMKAAAARQDAAGADRPTLDGPTGDGHASAAAMLQKSDWKRRVLLVEDNDLIRMSEADMLAELGCDVLEAGSAEVALSVLEQDAVDVVVSDLGLPRMSGEDFCREVRQRWPQIAIVFATGKDKGPVFEDQSRTALLRKPHGVEDLAKALLDVEG